MTTFPPTMTEIPSAPPEGVPVAKWNQAVTLIRAEATTAPSFWSLWCRCYPRFLRWHGDGVTFLALYRVFDDALGGRAPGPFETGPGVACGERTAGGSTSEPFGGVDAGRTHVADGIQ